jgi:hypothetical protein
MIIKCWYCVYVDGLFPLLIWSDLLCLFWLIFGLKSVLSDMSIAVVCSQGSLAWNIFLHPFTIWQCIFLSVTCVSWMQQMLGSCFCSNLPFYVFWMENWEVGGVAQEVECLLCRHKALTSNPVLPKNKIFSFIIEMYIVYPPTHFVLFS